MSKKKWITTAVFILIPVLTVWIYLQFFRPSYLFHEPQAVDVEVNGAREVVLQAEDSNLLVRRLELEFSGELDGVMDIAVSGSKGLVQVISLKGPKADRSFVFPWEFTDCTLIFAGRENSKGKFHIEYRFQEGD